jgi:hypothetical protein
MEDVDTLPTGSFCLLEYPDNLKAPWLKKGLLKIASGSLAYLAYLFCIICFLLLFSQPDFITAITTTGLLLSILLRVTLFNRTWYRASLPIPGFYPYFLN